MPNLRRSGRGIVAVASPVVAALLVSGRARAGAPLSETRCTNRAPKHGTPDGFPLDKAAGHPRWKYELEPSARCEREAGHDGAHRAGQLLWHDPPLLLVGGVPFAASGEAS